MVNGITFAAMKYKFIKVSEYARQHGISPKSVYMQIKNGKLKSETKFGLILIKVKT